MTVFSVSLPFNIIVRIWDIYLVEGAKILYRVALAILKLNQQKLLQTDLPGTLEVLTTFYKTVNADELVKASLGFTFSIKKLRQLQKDYLENPDPNIMASAKLVA